MVEYNFKELHDAPNLKFPYKSFDGGDVNFRFPLSKKIHVKNT